MVLKKKAKYSLSCILIYEASPTLYMYRSCLATISEKKFQSTDLNADKSSTFPYIVYFLCKIITTDIEM